MVWVCARVIGYERGNDERDKKNWCAILMQFDGVSVLSASTTKPRTAKVETAFTAHPQMDCKHGNIEKVAQGHVLREFPFVASMRES